MSDDRIAAIDGREYRYLIRPEDGTYLFQVDGGSYRFRQWTWGEKNRVTDAATDVDPATGRLHVDIARFNELMLATSLVEADSLAPITPAALRQLNPVLGDTLLAIAYWVNELPATEKKTPRRPPRTPATPGPDHLSDVPGIWLDSPAGTLPAGSRRREICPHPQPVGAARDAGGGR